jgi:hypothetical protein
MKKVILAATISISLLSCKEDAKITYNYADKPLVLNCENIDKKLLNEAYYAFENAILIHAKNTNRRPNVPVTIESALKNYITRSRGNIKITDYTTKESFEVFNSLKSLAIWNGTQLKEKANITNCIGNSISNSTIKGSFNTLRSVESLNPKLIAATIVDNRTIRDQFKDKALMTYVAFDMYYAKFFNTDFSAISFLTEKENVVAPAKPATTIQKPVIGKALNLDVKK